LNTKYVYGNTKISCPHTSAVEDDRGMSANRMA